jgi:putative membrane protein
MAEVQLTLPRRTFPLRLWPLPLGLLVLAGLWLGPLPEMSRTAFSPHMLIHLGIVALAAPLVAIGVARLLEGVPPAAKTGRAALLAAWFDMLVVIGWHVPALHDAASWSQAVFALEQLSYFAAGFAMWFFAFAGRSKENAASGAAAFFMTFMHMTLLGSVLIFAPRLLYDTDFCLGAFGFAPLDDQRFGGMLMIGWGSLVYLAGALILAARLLADPHPEQRRA